MHPRAHRSGLDLGVHSRHELVAASDQIVEVGRDLVDEVVLDDLPLPGIENSPTLGHFVNEHVPQLADGPLTALEGHGDGHDAVSVHRHWPVAHRKKLVLQVSNAPVELGPASFGGDCAGIDVLQELLDPSRHFHRARDRPIVLVVDLGEGGVEITEESGSGERLKRRRCRVTQGSVIGALPLEPFDQAHGLSLNVGEPLLAIDLRFAVPASLFQSSHDFVESSQYFADRCADRRLEHGEPGPRCFDVALGCSVPFRLLPRQGFGVLDGRRTLTRMSRGLDPRLERRPERCGRVFVLSDTV